MSKLRVGIPEKLANYLENPNGFDIVEKTTGDNIEKPTLEKKTTYILPKDHFELPPEVLAKLGYDCVVCS